ncbi:MAG: hypothetical protein Q8O31_06580 [Rhodocyclaceae bacterium]|nr:hypothetical protein [Rhodocyclaceae bacterium]
MKQREIIIGEVRYAIRLTERTARLYRRVQTVGVFFSIIGGSGALSLLSAQVPLWIGMTGSLMLTLSGAALIAIRPADKAAQNEADRRRYVALLAKQSNLSDEQLSAALDEAHQGDTQEVEPLRAVAYNDVVTESGCFDAVMTLTRTQKLWAAFA